MTQVYTNLTVITDQNARYDRKGVLTMVDLCVTLHTVWDCSTQSQTVKTREY